MRRCAIGRRTFVFVRPLVRVRLDHQQPALRIESHADGRNDFRLLRDKLGLHEYPRGADPWAMGDEHGLLLCLARKGQTWGEHTPTSVRWDVFPTEATVAGPADGHFAFDGFPYRVQVEK